VTGPEHYKVAENTLYMASVTSDDGQRRDFLVQAQVHATLALAAATAQGLHQEMSTWDADAWEDTAGTPVPEQAGGDQP